MSQDRIILAVPARSDYARTVRLTAAELAVRLGMSYDEVDDVRIAAEEAFVYACGCADEDSEIKFTFTVGDGCLTTEVGPLPTSCLPGAAASEGYAEFILKSVCDDLAIEHEADGCTMRFSRRVAVEGPVG